MCYERRLPLCHGACLSHFWNSFEAEFRKANFIMVDEFSFFSANWLKTGLKNIAVIKTFSLEIKQSQGLAEWRLDPPSCMSIPEQSSAQCQTAFQAFYC